MLSRKNNSAKQEIKREKAHLCPFPKDNDVVSNEIILSMETLIKERLELRHRSLAVVEPEVVARLEVERDAGLGIALQVDGEDLDT